MALSTVESHVPDRFVPVLVKKAYSSCARPCIDPGSMYAGARKLQQRKNGIKPFRHTMNLLQPVDNRDQPGEPPILMLDSRDRPPMSISASPFLTQNILRSLPRPLIPLLLFLYNVAK